MEDLEARFAGEVVPVDEEGASHLRAARVRPGGELSVTDGRGRLWAARLDALERHGARCTLVERLAGPSVLDVELAFGIAAKTRTLWLVEKAVELGIAALQPVEFERSRSVADAGRSVGFWQKAERRARAAMLQCGGSSLPSVGRPCDLEAYLRGLDEGAGGIAIALDARGDFRLLDALAEGPDGEARTRLLVGPEGGITDDERRACRAAGLRFAHLGDRTLRFETAAIAAASAVCLLSR